MTSLPPALKLYAAATGLLEPLAPTLLRKRAERGKEDPERLHERMGRGLQAPPEGPVIWLHGVSVGESLSLLPVVEGLARRRPDAVILVTSGTVTAAKLLARRLPLGVIHQYAPIDGPGAVARFLNHWRPALGVLAESDLWPNLILAAKARGIPLALVSAHMTAASAGRWSKAPGAARKVLRAFDLILPQDAESEARLKALGAAVGEQLNLKLVGDPLPCDPMEYGDLRAVLGHRQAILAASTHPGEEQAIVRAARAAAPDALLIVAPRHPERGEEIAEQLSAERLAVARRSQGGLPGPATEVYVADTLGELGLFLRLVDVVVMGGSFVPGIGGHNPLEPARLGVPILAGPHVFKARELYEGLQAVTAAIEAPDQAALTRHIRGLLMNPAIIRRMGAAGQRFAAGQGAALDHALDLLAPLVAPPAAA